MTTEAMIEASELKTDRGVFRQDQSGLWHYDYRMFGIIDDAAIDALKHRPNGAAWFWFNSTPSPIFANDTSDQLIVRWAKWRTAYQKHPKDLINYLQDLSKDTKST